jgi:predicted small lipoprotein YifL
MREFKYSKYSNPILAALLGATLFLLAACGQRGPLKLPEPAPPAQQIPQPGTTK